MNDNSVLQNWVKVLPMKMQSTLLSSLKGGDGLSRNDISKSIIKAIRGTVVEQINADTFYLTTAVNMERVDTFIYDLDRYIIHFIGHLYQGIEVLAYKHPDEKVRDFWYIVYLKIVNKLCLNPETEEQLDERLK